MTSTNGTSGDHDSLLRRGARARGSGQSAQRKDQYDTPTLNPDRSDHLATVLFVVRESADYEWVLLAKMLEQTLMPYAQQSEVALLLTHGPDLLLNNTEGERAREAVSGQRLDVNPGGKIYAVRANVGDVHLLIGLTSAGKVTGTNGIDNLWADELTRAVRETRPQRLVTGPFSRMIRNQDFAGPISRELRRSGSLVCPAENREGFCLDNQSGLMLWNLFVAMAHSEWVMTLTRLQTGFVFELKNGRFPRSGTALPLGYRRVTTGPDRGRVVPALEERDTVRALIEMGASDRPLAEIADELAKLGVHGRQGGLQRNLADLDRPDQSAGRMFAHLPTYLQGGYLHRQANTIPDITEFHGEQVLRHKEDDRFGYFEFRLDFGVPEGGWAPAELIDAAIERRLGDRSRNTTTTTSPPRAALIGIARWSDDTHQYRLVSDETTYALRRRPLERDGDGAAKRGRWRVPGETEIVGRYRVGELHGLIAEVLRGVLTEPQPTLIAGPHDPDVAQLDKWRTRVGELSAQADTARELAILAKSGSDRNAFADKASGYDTEALRLRAAIAAQENAQALAGAQATGADAQRLAATAELIERSRGADIAAVNLAAAQAIAELRFDAVPGVTTSQVHIKVRVATTAGPLVLGPFARTIRSTARGRTGSNNVTDRDAATVTELLTATAAERGALLKREGLNERGARRGSARVLRTKLPAALAVSVLIDHPVEQARRAILGLEHDLEADFAAELVAIYHDPEFAWTPYWCRGNATGMRRALAWIQRYFPTEDGVPVYRLREATGLGEVALYAMLNTVPGKYARDRPGTAPLLETTTQWRPRVWMKPEDRRVRQVTCPHCESRTLSQVLVVPELPSGRLCTVCLRSPDTPWPFPAEYALPWVGPAQGQRKVRDPGRSRQEPVGTRQQPFTLPPRVRPQR